MTVPTPNHSGPHGAVPARARWRVPVPWLVAWALVLVTAGVAVAGILGRRRTDGRYLICRI